MLQIISGKFFTGNGRLNQEENNAILYSNLSWAPAIKTVVADLRPADARGSHVASYVLRYTNCYEQAPGDILHLAIPTVAVEQFALLVSFYFEAFFHPEREYVERLCRDKPRNSFDTTIPSVFVPRFFDLPRQTSHGKSAGFAAFIDKVMAMPRKQYLLLISCLSGFFESLEAVGENFDLAYSMMVYTLEALSKSVEQPPAAWDDYEENVRRRLDKELAIIEPVIADRIRGALLESSHVKLTKRFVDFISSHVTDEYFTSEAEGINHALGKSQPPTHVE